MVFQESPGECRRLNMYGQSQSLSPGVSPALRDVLQPSCVSHSTRDVSVSPSGTRVKDIFNKTRFNKIAI